VDRKKRDELIKARYDLADMIRGGHSDRFGMSIDVAVPISGYPEIIALARELSKNKGIPGYVFGHAGDGNLHLILMGKIGDPKEAAVADQINRKMVEKALSLGGTATGEHGVGLGKKVFMEAEHGVSLEWMKKIKHLFDPNHILNPDKIFP
jgi:D-lactate dehydrogenase (cytochrome)